MAGAPEERYKAAMANAVKTIKSQKEQIAELEARLKAAEEALGAEKKRVQELELALKRKRDSEMDVDQGDDEDEDWDGRPAAKKGKASGAAASSTKPAVSSLDILSMGKGGGGGEGAEGVKAAAGAARGRKGKEEKPPAAALASAAAAGRVKKEKAEGPISKTAASATAPAAPAPPAAEEGRGRREEKEKEKEQKESREGAGTTIEGAGTILEEVAQLWGLVKDKPFADAKFAQLCLDRYVFLRELPATPEPKLDAGVQRVVLLLREAGHISPQEACRRLLVTYKRRMAQALRRDRGGRWLREPLPRQGEAGRLLGGAAALVLRLCDPESYGAYFLELVLDELLQQLYKVEKAAARGAGGKAGGGGAGDDEEDGDDAEDEEEPEAEEDHDEPEKPGEPGTPGGEKEKERDPDRLRHREESFRRQRHGFAAAALYTALCRATGALGRCRALVYDAFVLNGQGVALGQLPAILGLWPAVLGPKDGLMARALLALAHEAYLAQRRRKDGAGDGGQEEKEKGKDKVGDEAVCWASELAFEGLATSLMGLPPPAKAKKGDEGDKEEEALAVYEGIPAIEAVAEDALAALQGPGASSASVGEAVRALVLLCGARPLAWAEERVLQPFATGEASTPPGVMRLLAAVGRELSLRDAVEHRSGDVMRRLLLCFSEAITAAARRLEAKKAAALDGASDWLDEEEHAAVVAAEAEEEDGGGGVDKAALREMQLWACKGLAELPGIGVGELKPVVQWCRGMAAAEGEEAAALDLTAAVPAHMLRTLVYSQARPHCVALVRERGLAGPGALQSADLELQAILHDVSVRAAPAEALAQLTHHAFRQQGGGGRAAALNGDGGGGGTGSNGGPVVPAATRERNRALWAADGGLEHVAVWHVYSNSKMDELDYPNRKPSEAVLLEGDAVGSPLLGTELRSLLFELRYRPFPWDVLLLCFSLPPGGSKAKVSPYATALPKGAHPSRRGYILSHTGAVKLLRAWDQYESVEGLLAAEARAGRLTVLIPGDARPVVHPSAEDRMVAALQAAAGGGGGGGRGSSGGGGLQAPEPLPGGFGHGFGMDGLAVAALPAPAFPGFSVVGGQEEDDIERPPSPGFRPSDD